MNRNYKILAIAPAMFKGLAWFGLSLGIISAFIIFAGMGMLETPRWTGIVTFILGAIYFFVFTVVAEVVSLLLDMNARIK